jgi:hypothetical protein
MNYHNAYRAVFPVEPMQTTYWLDGVELLSDIPKVMMLDWTMTGARASTARSYFDADAFRYYLICRPCWSAV